MRKLRRASKLHLLDDALKFPRSPDFCYGESLLQEIILMSIPQQPNIRLVNAPITAILMLIQYRSA